MTAGELNDATMAYNCMLEGENRIDGILTEIHDQLNTDDNPDVDGGINVEGIGDITKGSSQMLLDDLMSSIATTASNVTHMVATNNKNATKVFNLMAN